MQDIKARALSRIYYKKKGVEITKLDHVQYQVKLQNLKYFYSVFTFQEFCAKFRVSMPLSTETMHAVADSDNIYITKKYIIVLDA